MDMVQPKLVDAGPHGETSVSGEITFTFDAPVRAMGEKMEVDPAQLGLTIEPPLSGTLRWESPTRLVFRPTHALPPSSAWHIRAAGTVTSEWATDIPVSADFEFHTPRPTVRVEVPESTEDDDSEASRVHWKARVLLRPEPGIRLAELERHVRATAHVGPGKTVDVPVRVRYADRAEQRRWRAAGEHVRVLEPLEAWPLGATVMVEVSGDLPTTGTSPMTTPVRASFTIEPGLRVDDVRCEGGNFKDGCGIGPLILHFSNPVPRSQLARIRPSHTVRGFVVHPGKARERSDPAGFDSAVVWGDFQRGDVLTLTADRMSDVYGQPLAQPLSHTVKFVDPPVELTLRPEKGTLPPDQPHIGVDARYLETVILSVAPLDAPTFAKFQRLEATPSRDALPAPPMQREIALQPEGPYAWSSHAIDLRDFVGPCPGPVWVEVAPGRISARGRDRPRPPTERGIYQLSGLSLSGLTSLPRSIARVTRLPDHTPVPGARLVRWTTAGSQDVARTDAQGRVELGSVRDWPPNTVLEVVTDDDRLVYDAREHDEPSNSPSTMLEPHEHIAAALATDRGAYRPGDEVHVTGWSAIATPYHTIGLRSTPPRTPVTLTLRDHQGAKVAEKKVVTTAEGKFWGTLRVPADGALGFHAIEATLLGSETLVHVVVEDFRAREFEVRATTKTRDIHHGAPIHVDVSASYYFGEPVSMTSIRADAECRPWDVRPRGIDGSWLVGWGRSGADDIASGSASLAKRDPGHGHAQLTLVPRFTHVDLPYSCTVAVGVTDASDQMAGANAYVRVDPEFYLVMEPIERGEAPYDTAIVVRTVREDGTNVPVEDITAEITRTYETEQTRMVRGKPIFDGWIRRTETLPPCRLATRKGSPEARCALPALPRGSYTIALSARRPGRPYVAWIDATFEVSRTHSPVQRSTSTAPRFLKLEVPQDEVDVGDRIVARISAPFDGAGELVLAAGGVRKAYPFVLKQGTARVPLQVGEGWVPTASLIAMARAPATPHALPRLHHSEERVRVSHASRMLSVELEMPGEAGPGDELPLAVRVADRRGNPVQAHVSVWAVDEAVLALYPAPRPWFSDAFAPYRTADVRVLDSLTALVRPFTRRADPYKPLYWTEGDVYVHGEEFGLGLFGGAAGGGGRLSNTRPRGSALATERSNFEVTPLYIGDLQTDAQGVAHIRGRLPDDLTTFRVTAIASAGLGNDVRTGRFGLQTQKVRVRRPLVVRPVLPRQLHPGDVAELRVLVQNLDGPAGTVDVTLEPVTETDALELLSPAGVAVEVERGGQAQARVRVRAHRVATPQIRATARHRSTDQSDVMRLSLPIARESTVLERVAVYGDLDLDRPAALPLKVPPAAALDPSHGGLSVSMASTLLGGLEDAARYLVEYPHGCSEQTSSRIVPLLALGDLAKTFPLGIDDPEAFVAAGIDRLRSMQVADGGFSYWPGGKTAARYPSAYATWVLVRARRSSFDVPAPMLDRALAHLAHALKTWSAAPAPPIEDDIVMTLALRALAEAQKLSDAHVFDALWARRDALPVFARATLLMAMHATDPADARSPILLAELLAQVDERNDSARVETSGQRWWSYFDSDDRSTALVLSALLHIDPEHRLVGTLARGLMRSRRAGRWSNTQENAYALLALADYARVRERDEPRFDAAVWFGGERLVHHTFVGRSMDEARNHVPMSTLRRADPKDPQSQVLLLEKRGAGHLYYRVGLDWAPTGPAEARAEGIALRRTLRRESGEVVGDAVQVGELLALDVEVTTTSDLAFVALQIPLPAGLEGVHRNLGAGTGVFRHAGQRGPWVTHEELRSDRVMIYADALPHGSHRTSIVVRATTPGTFHWPAAVGEMMYSPEVYGRTKATTLVVRP